MKKFGIVLGVTMLAMLLCSQADAQVRRALSLFKQPAPIYGAADIAGMTTTNYTNRISPRSAVRNAVTSRNFFTPEPIYTYSNAGVTSQRTHAWNQSEAIGRPWAGDYQTWRWRTPTALVVPPTASYHSTYAWGVGQVRSTPIHSQFGVGGGGIASGAAGQTPYHPWSTEQFGYYPVRAPW